MGVALILKTLTNPYFVSMQKDAEAAASKDNVSLTVAAVPMRHLLQEVQGVRVAGHAEFIGLEGDDGTGRHLLPAPLRPRAKLARQSSNPPPSCPP